MNKIILLAWAVFSLGAIGGCSLHQPKDIENPFNGKIEIPKDTAVIKFVKKDGDVDTFLANGKKFKPCKFCPPGRQEECAKDTTGKYCLGNVNSTINKVESSVLIQSSVNPICYTEIIDGKSRQRCICLPGESHSLCD